MPGHDALLIVSFGGPEGPDDVLPFLERVTAGRNVPPQRLAQVAATYERFGGVSPINGHTRRLIAAVGHELAQRGPDLPIYWGNRNWHPLLADTIAEMARAGVGRALAFVTSAFSSYSGCRQYLDDIARARMEVGPRAPTIDKLRLFFNHPGFIEPVAARVSDALARLPDDTRDRAHLLFTAHSIPTAMAATSDYQLQLAESARLVRGIVGGDHPSSVAFQSRSGAPSVPWLEPDVGEVIDTLAAAGCPGAVLVPLGFVCDHLEVVYDLDVVALERARAAGLPIVRAGTVGDDPGFATMVAELVRERLSPPGAVPRRALGVLGPSPDACAEGCCRFS